MEKLQSLLNIQDLSDFLKISVSSIYRLTSRKQIPFVKIGSRIVFQPEKIREWLELQSA